MVYSGEELEMKITDYIIASSDEMSTFLLDLPPVKEAYKRNAVSFELMKFYPGDSSSISIDYFSNKTNTLGFIISNDFLALNPNKKIISDVLLVQNFFVNAFVVLIHDSSFSIALIKNGEVLDFIQDCSFYELESKVSDSDISDKFFVDFSSSHSDDELFAVLDNLHFLRFDFASKINNKILKNSFIFSEKKASKDKNLFYVALVFVFLILLGFDFYEFNLSKRYVEQSSLLKKQYNELSKRLSTFQGANVTTGQGVNKGNSAIGNGNNYSVNIPSWYLFSVLKGYKSYLKVSNISIDNDTFRIDGICNDALSFVSYLSSVALMRDVILNQVQNTDEGFQKFVLTGKYNHE